MKRTLTKMHLPYSVLFLLFGNSNDDLCSFFIALASNTSKDHCNRLLLVLKRKCDVIWELTRKFQSTGAILDHSTKMAYIWIANLKFVKESTISSRGLTYNCYLKNARSVLQSQVPATHSKDSYL